jgi:hypothetical protein
MVKNMNDSCDYLFPEEKEYLLSLGYEISTDIFNRDICSRWPKGSSTYNYYIKATSSLAMTFGYRDHWDKNFQRARPFSHKIYTRS